VEDIIGQGHGRSFFNISLSGFEEKCRLFLAIEVQRSSNRGNNGCARTIDRRTTNDVALIRTLYRLLTSFDIAAATVRVPVTKPAMETQATVGDLCNEIHLIFRRQKFQNISDFEYEALKPSLQFASLLLTTPELAGFPHAILVAPYKHVPHPDDEALDVWAFQEKGAKLSTRDMAMCNLALTTLADMVVFVASSKTAGKTDGKAEDLHMHCGETCAESQIPSQNTHLWHGSTIRFSREDVDAHTQSDFCDLYQTDSGIKRRTFETAKVLLHELMHAMSHARLGWLDSIPFGSNKAVETGYEWENHVFGGVICDSNLGQTELRNDVSLMIRDWPAPSITRTYQRLGYAIDVLEEPFVDRDAMVDSAGRV
jgi:hypothetical protein